MPGFIECAFSQERKIGEHACGDTFVSQRTQDGRTIVVMSDGLGSGIKAGVLSTLTATMALRCIDRRVPLDATARTIMRTLPVCAERRVSYATFCILEVEKDNRVRVMEFDSPPLVHVRGGELVPATAGRGLREYAVEARENDRLVLFTDGVNQAGMGTRLHPLGWGQGEVGRFVRDVVRAEPGISAADLAAALVAEAKRKDGWRPKDDITCAVLYFRRPRQLLVVTGPPYRRDKDSLLSQRVSAFPGKVVVCGGTTAQIIAGNLNRGIQVDLRRKTGKLPPASMIDGVEMVTEGILTLGAVARLLERNQPGSAGMPVALGADDPDWPASDIVRHLLESDCIQFMVGTRINEAHQDPAMPVELEIRRNIVKRLAASLKEKYLKDVEIEYL